MDWLVSIVGIEIHRSKRAQGWIFGKGFKESVLYVDATCLGVFACVVRKFSNSICLFGRTKTSLLDRIALA